MHYIIYRPYWRRGSPGSKLLDHFGTMCCLGHVAAQCGISDILDVCTPSGMNHRDRVRWPEPLRPRVAYAPTDETRNTVLVSDMMAVNDIAIGRVFHLQSVDHTFDTPRHWSSLARMLHVESDRERVLTSLAATAGITLVFTDDPNDILCDVRDAHERGMKGPWA